MTEKFTVPVGGYYRFYAATTIQGVVKTWEYTLWVETGGPPPYFLPSHFLGDRWRPRGYQEKRE